MTGKEYLEKINSPEAEKQFSLLYGEPSSAKERYSGLLKTMIEDSPAAFPKKDFPETGGDLRIFSVPGRSELGGNHTDHNQGKVLAASIQLDAAAVVAPRNDNQVFFRSPGHPDVKIDISDLSQRKDETGTTEALIRGIAAEMTSQGTPVGGFTANGSNLVLTGSGLSSSAAIEVLLAKIFDNIYCGGKRSALDLAKIGQKAENIYFGKPSGLMDQTASASGGAVSIDFGDKENPKVRGVAFNPEAAGYALCVVATGGSHANLVDDYAAIPNEMKAAASFLGKSVLREADEDIFMSKITEIRKAAGDRAVLRAIHFYNENKRVDAMLTALDKMNVESNRKQGMADFLNLVNESGASSWQLLQNIYTTKLPEEQGISLALALTKNFLGRDGACRVHGGGFAGTIQSYIPMERIKEYKNLMEGIFGEGAFTVLRIRPIGALELSL